MEVNIDKEAFGVEVARLSDDEGNVVQLRPSVNGRRLYIDTSRNLSRNLCIELWPLLKRFAETGKLAATCPKDCVGVYVASRASSPQRPAMWRTARAAGVPIVSTWIDEAGEGDTGDYAKLWDRITAEIASAEYLLLYAETEDFPLKGALVEAGIALGLGKPVVVCLPSVNVQARNCRPIGSWINHRLVTREDDINVALRDGQWGPRSFGNSNLSPEQCKTKERDALETPDEVKREVLRLNGWEEVPSGLDGLSRRWHEPAYLGVHRTLDGAYRIQVERNKHKVGEVINAECDAACDCRAGYPPTRQEIAADWIRKCKVTDELEQALKKAHHDVGLASDALVAVFGNLKGKPLVLTVDSVLYVVTFYLGTLRYEEAIGAEGATV